MADTLYKTTVQNIVAKQPQPTRMRGSLCVYRLEQKALSRSSRHSGSATTRHLLATETEPADPHHAKDRTFWTRFATRQMSLAIPAIRLGFSFPCLLNFRANLKNISCYVETCRLEQRFRRCCGTHVGNRLCFAHIHLHFCRALVDSDDAREESEWRVRLYI